MSTQLMAVAAVAAATLVAFPCHGGMDEAKRWIDREFQPSTLSKEQQLKEMEWFVNAAEPFKGMEINVLSETIPTHEYESKTLTKAFEEITGIKVNHQVLGEGEVVQAVQTQMQTNRNLYDGYINDSDLIGTHSRLQLAVNLTDWMPGKARRSRCRRSTSTTSSASRSRLVPTASCGSCRTSSSPTCTGSATTGSNDRSCRPGSRQYGYDLGVPLNWSAYEDIAEFFSVT